MIVGGRIIEVNAKKKNEERVEGMNVNINIEEVKAEKDFVVVKYEHKIAYLPDNAEIYVRGELLAEESDKDKKEIEDEWKNKKSLPPRFAEDVINAASYSGTAVGTLLSFSLGIPAPLNLPRAKLGSPQRKTEKAKAG